VVSSSEQSCGNARSMTARSMKVKARKKTATQRCRDLDFTNVARLRSIIRTKPYPSTRGGVGQFHLPAALTAAS